MEDVFLVRNAGATQVSVGQSVKMLEEMEEYTNPHHQTAPQFMEKANLDGGIRCSIKNSIKFVRLRIKNEKKLIFFHKNKTLVKILSNSSNFYKSKKKKNLHTTIILVGVLVLLGNSLQCTKESLAFDEHMLFPRS